MAKDRLRKHGRGGQSRRTRHLSNRKRRCGPPVEHVESENRALRKGTEHPAAWSEIGPAACYDRFSRCKLKKCTSPSGLSRVGPNGGSSPASFMLLQGARAASFPSSSPRPT